MILGKDPIIYRVYTFQVVVQDFFHQQIAPRWNTAVGRWDSSIRKNASQVPRCELLVLGSVYILHSTRDFIELPHSLLEGSFVSIGKFLSERKSQFALENMLGLDFFRMELCIISNEFSMNLRIFTTTIIPSPRTDCAAICWWFRLWFMFQDLPGKPRLRSEGWIIPIFSVYQATLT